MFAALRRLVSGPSKTSTSNNPPPDTLRDPLESGGDDALESKLKGLSSEQLLGEYRAPLRQVLEKGMVAENLDFLDAIDANVSPKEIYETFVIPDAPKEINSHWTHRGELATLAQKGQYDQMDFSAIKQMALASILEHKNEMAENALAKQIMSEKEGKTSEKAPTPKPKARLTGLTGLIHKTFKTNAWKEQEAGDAQRKAQEEKLRQEQLEEKRRQVRNAIYAMDRDTALGEFRDLVLAQAQTECNLEPFEFADAVQANTTSPKDLYDTYVRAGATKEVNVGKADKLELDLLAESGLWDAMDFTTTMNAALSGALTDIQARMIHDPVAQERMARVLGLGDLS